VKEQRTEQLCLTNGLYGVRKHTADVGVNRSDARTLFMALSDWAYISKLMPVLRGGERLLGHAVHYANGFCDCYFADSLR
jgi:hypothetical protein